jgi:hypothetical protein
MTSFEVIVCLIQFIRSFMNIHIRFEKTFKDGDEVYKQKVGT